MGEAKRKREQTNNNYKLAQKNDKRFQNVSSFPVFKPKTRNNKLDAVRAYHHLMRLIFVRAKFIHKDLLQSITNRNSYIAFILLKSYWETVSMLGYSYITASNLIESNDYSELLKWTIKHAMGGKKYPSDEILAEKGRNREEYTQTNLLTQMEKVDKHFNKTIGEGLNVSDLKSVYDEFIAEGGHPTFLGLSLCDELQSDGTMKIDVNKTGYPYDYGMFLNHLVLADIYFFHYWDKFQGEVDNQLKNSTA